MPMNSWPMRFPVVLGGIELYGQRSLPQMHARVTRTKASVGSTSPGIGNGLDAHIVRAVHHSRSHLIPSILGMPVFIRRTVRR